MLANRWAGSDIASTGRPRLTEVLTDLGGRIRPSYTQPDPCSAFQNQNVPKWQNASDCFYVARADDTHDHYKKYLVNQVQVIDRDGSPTQTTSYGYSNNPDNATAAALEGSGIGAGWHSDNQIITPLAKQGWTEFRGYQTVTVQQLRASGSPAKEITRFFRGLHGDHKDLNNTRSESVLTAACPVGTPASATGTCNQSTADADALAGQVLEHRILDGAGMEQSADQHGYAMQTVALSPGAPSETRPWGVNTHPIVRVDESTTRTLYFDASLPRNRQHVITRGFESTYGRQVWEQDGGDTGTGIGASCGWTTWNDNLTDWVLDAERRTVRATGTCGGSEPTGSVLIGRREFLYDNLADGNVGAGNVTRVLDYTGPNGNVTSPNQYAATKYAYDSFGRVTKVQSPNNYTTNPLDWTNAVTTTYIPDTSGPVTGVETSNELGHTTTTTLDPRWGVPTKVADPNASTTNPAPGTQGVTALGYDTFGRLTSVLRPGDTAGSPSTTYAYAVNQWSPSVITTTSYPTSGGAGIISYTYLDSLGRAFQAEASSATGGRIITGTQYDDQGNASVAVDAFVPSPAGTPGTPVANFYDATFTNALPSRTQTSFDELDRPTALALKSAATTVWTSTTAYNGFTTTATPAANGTNGPTLHATATTTDLYGRVKTSVIKRGSPSDLATSYGYDTAGDLRTITSPKGAVTSYTYDWAGNRTQTIDPDAGTSTATYTPGGQVSYAKDGANLETWTTLDAIDRVTKIETGPSASKVLTVQNTYDTALKGTLASATRYDGTNAYTEATTYDIRYRPASVTRSIPGALLGGTGTQSWVTSMTYDRLDRPLQFTYPAAGGLAAETVTAAYTGGYASTLTTNLAGSPAYVSGTGYTNIGQVADRTLGTAGATGSLKRGFGYETATGRLASVTGNTPSTAATNTVQNQTFAYANTGEVTAITNTADGQRECYGYDGLSRLTLAGTTPTTGTGCTPDMVTGPNPYKETYAYDDDGNLTTLERFTTATAKNTWTYSYGNTTLGTTALTGGPHAMTVARKDAVATGGYSYNGAGRQISKTNGSGTSPVATTWNSLGQLASVAGANNTATYGPDSSRWIRKTISGTTTTTTVYLPGQEIKRAVTGTTATTSGVRYYSHGGDIVATRTGTGLTWIVDNYQASNTTAVNAATAAVTRDRYTPYGLNRATSTNTGFALPAVTGSDRGWLGQTRDDGSGLDYLNARYYDPATAHFISPDPINNNETPQAANPYTYADDNPTTLTDPSGLEAGSWCNTSACAAKTKQSTALYNKTVSGKNPKMRVVAVVRIAPKKPAVTKRAVVKTVVKSVIKTELSRLRGTLNAGINIARDTMSITMITNPAAAVNTYRGMQQLDKIKANVNRAADARGIAGSGAAYQTGYWGTTIGSYAIPVGGGARTAARVAATGARRLGAAIGERTAARLARPACFVAGTRVLMADGTTKKIEDIRVGDKVRSRDPNTGRDQTQTVTRTYIHHNIATYTITAGGEKITTTAEHPFHVAGRGWTNAADLQPGDQLTPTDGAPATIETVQPTGHTETVYNLEISQTHTYYIRTRHHTALVHNTCGPISDATIIARGGTADLPAAGEVFSGAQGRTVQEAAAGLKHGQFRSTTAGEIRRAGGTVERAPELDPRVGATNHQHVNVCLGQGACSWSDLTPNPVPKSGRFGGADYPFYDGYP